MVWLEGGKRWPDSCEFDEERAVQFKRRFEYGVQCDSVSANTVLCTGELERRKARKRIKGG